MLTVFGSNFNEKNSANGLTKQRLRLYNQYPGCYINFAQMTTDLVRIKAMGFDQVWVNPFYQTCQHNLLNSNKVHCPYAMSDHMSINPEYGDSFRDVIKYTKRANELDIAPLFDLVARHVAIDHPFVNGDPHLLKKGIDTKRWFLRHPNGNFVIKGMDENYTSIKDDPWSDVVAFDYSNPVVRQEIFDYFWKPFIDFNIRKLGFQGARLDAVGSISRETHELLLPYIDKVCQEVHNKKAYLVAETVGLRYMPFNGVVQGLVTHTMNNSFWMPGPEGRIDRDKKEVKYELWRDDSNWHETSKSELQKIGPSAGHSGSHDEDRYPHILKSAGIKDPNLMKQRMIEMIMVAAFGSNGGHILAFGDEFGIEDKVDLLHRKVVHVAEEKKYDLKEEITEINSIVNQLPSPSKNEWTQRVYLDKYPELVIFIVHKNTGFDGDSHIIIGNINSTKHDIRLDQAMLDEILKANGRNTTAAQLKQPNKVYLCGNVKNALGDDHEPSKKSRSSRI